MLRVYCSRYMDDWDRHMLQVMGAYDANWSRESSSINAYDASLVGLDEVLVPQEINLVNDAKREWIDDCSEPEVEFKLETEQMHDQELTNCEYSNGSMIC